MSENLATLLVLGQDWMAIAVVVFLRLGSAFLVLPAIGEQFIPVRVRLGAALALTVLLSPAVAAEVPGPISLEHFLLSEPISGLLLGLALRLVVHALQMAGTIAAQSTSLSQIMGGALAEPQPAMGSLLALSGLTLAVMAGLHVHLAGTLLRSYEILPAGQFPLGGDVGEWGVRRVAAAFSLAFSLSAPFLMASLLYNVALGVINKAMPQLMVAFVGAPAITLGGLVLLLLTTPFLLPVWLAAFQAALADPFGPLP